MKSMLIDITKCTGCESCVKACGHSHGLPPDVPSVRESNDGLSAYQYSTVLHFDDSHHAKKQCLHCMEPGCAAACPVGAIRKTKEGPVVYDPSKCIGCRYCMLACPVGMPRYEWDKKIPYMKKCDMCIDRLRENRLPACVEACPNGVCQVGEREELLAVAHKRIEQNPQTYLDHVYGEKELNGTSVMYLSNVSLAGLGWPKIVGDKSMLHYTEGLVEATPWIGGGVAAVLSGVLFIIKRRMQLQAEVVVKQSQGNGIDN